MPKTSAAPRAATLKQAKAAFKARGNPTLSEREKKQLQRSIDLDKRAFAAREREKRRAEAANDKSEKERKKKEVVEQARLGTQRRRDKFGYASSQFHLGAFFGKPTVEHTANQEDATVKVEASGSDVFGEDDVDDESLLEALGSPACDTRIAKTPSSDSAAMPPPARPSALLCHNTDAQQPLLEDFESFFDDLGSSTQIARELEHPAPALAQRSRTFTNADSFGSGDFDLSMEDIAELDQSNTEAAKRELDCKKMPSPALPASAKRPLVPKKPTVNKTVQPKQPLQSAVEFDLFSNARGYRGLMPRPAIIAGKPSFAFEPQTSSLIEAVKPSALSRIPKQTSDQGLGFSLAQLEDFVDDNLQLTQVDPG